MNVASILNEKGRAVITAREDVSLADIVEILARRRIGAVVIVDAADRAVGIVSERDIIRRLARDGAVCLSENVRGTMTRELVTGTLGDTLDDLTTKMSEGRFRHLPIVSQDGLCGIVSASDVVKFRAAEVEMEAESLRSYIATG
ncbi:MAG: CBS domain-containing protein [Pseudomonadota bacterium]